MIYVAVINTDVYRSGGMVRSKEASIFYRERFNNFDDAGEYILNTFAGPRALFEAPYGDFDRIIQLCLKNNHIIYTWDLRSISKKDLRDIARKVTPDDWRYLIDKDPACYDICIQKVGWVDAGSISNEFIINHHEKVRFADIRDRDYVGSQSFYEWARKQRPEAFQQIENRLISIPDVIPTKSDVLREVLQKVKSSGVNVNDPDFNVYGLLGSPEVLATKSKYYKKIKFDVLLDYIKQAYLKLNKENVAAFSSTPYFKKNVGAGSA